jgi:hypothetical protein
LGALGIPAGGMVSTVLTGALTKAGTYGAIAGLGSMAMGGGFSKGAQVGGMAGLAVGGIGAALGGATGAAGAAGAAGAPAAAAGAPAAAASTVNGVAMAAPTIAAPAAAAAAAAPAAGGVGGMLAGFGQSGIGQFLMSPAGGTAIAGLGQGLATGMAAKDEQKAVEKEQNRITNSYDGAGDAMDLNSYPTAPRPGQAAPPISYARRDEKPQAAPRYAWNQSTGMIDRA